MSVLTEYGLKEADVEFLLAVHHIEQNPTKYDNTDVGKTVANVSSIREATDLTRSQIDYRVKPGENGRGFDEDEMNILRTYEATIEGQTIGPRSVELTEKGARVIAEIRDKRLGSGHEDHRDRVSPERVDELETQLSEVQNQIENLSDTMAEITQGRSDKIDENLGLKLKSILQTYPYHHYMLTEVFGIGQEDLKAAHEGDEQALQQLRVTAYNHLTKSLDEVETQELNLSAGSGGGESHLE